jgi:hypothetical protein
MIHEIAVQLQAALVARGVPFRVVDGPEPTKATSWADERVVLEYSGTDNILDVRSQRANSMQYAQIDFGAKATIYARSPKPGATPWEHRRRAHLAARHVLIALSNILVERKNAPTFTTGALVVPDDLAGTTVAGGAVYELPFSFATGVPDVTWAGDAADEATLAAITNRTMVSFAGGEDDDDDDQTVPALAEQASGD